MYRNKKSDKNKNYFNFFLPFPEPEFFSVALISKRNVRIK